MTEKRFEYYETNLVGHITKGVKIIDEYGNEKCINSIREIVWLLKELHEENQAVKDIINELNSMDFYMDSALLDEYLGKIARAVGCEWE